MGQAVLGLGHAHGQVAEAHVLVELEALGGGGLVVHPVRAVDPGGDRLDLVAQRHVVGVQQAEVGAPLLGRGPDRAGQVLGAGAAVGEVARDHGIPGAGRERDLADRRDLVGGVGREDVDRHDHRHAERAHVLDLLGEVDAAPPDALGVVLEQRRVERLAGHDPAHAAVHLERADRGHDHRGVAGQARTRGT